MDRIIQADCIEWMSSYDGAPFDAIVTDPPYGIGAPGVHGDMFKMGNKWFSREGNLAFGEWSFSWLESALGIVKPGAIAAVFAHARTVGYVQVAAEAAGWITFDIVCWLNGQGFMQRKGIGGNAPKCGCAKGPTREKVHHAMNRGWGSNKVGLSDKCSVCGRKVKYERLAGLAAGLKPSYEPILILRSPIDGTVDENYFKHGTGAFNSENTSPSGRSIPANVIIDQDVEMQLGDKSGFFYASKVSKSEREAGLDGFPYKIRGEHVAPGDRLGKRNHHMTVKPISLMSWLVDLVVPKGGMLLDPFAGSGSTIIAAEMLERDSIGLEIEEEYVQIANRRLAHWSAGRMKGI